MERCREYLVNDPASFRGRWMNVFQGKAKLYVELGCGKGSFTVKLAASEPDAAVIAIERVPDAMILAMERAKREDVQNVLFLDADAAKLNELFAPGEIDRIFINFCDPWPKSRDAKFRLTAPGFLRVYCDCLKTDGDILFKTDNLPLFDWSEEQFRKEGWEILSVTRDLHANGVHEIMTDYESKFNSEGIPIKKLRAGKTKQTLSTSAGPVARLRNASLSDARGMAE
jgi:tRNA (guanine-N7-)-methyltransferase